MPASLRFEGQRQAEQHGGGHVDPEDLQRRDRQRRAGDDGGEDHQALAEVGRQRPGDELHQVVVDAPPLLDGGLDGGEVVVGEHHRRRFLGHLGAGQAHGDADVGLLQRRRVVDAVAGHRHHLAIGLQRLDQPQLLFRFDAGEDVDLPAPRRAGPRRRGSPVRGRSGRGRPSSAILNCRAMARAVSAWSPVIIFTRMPAAWQASTAPMARGRGGSIMPTRPRKVRPALKCSGMHAFRGVHPARQRQHPQAVPRHGGGPRGDVFRFQRPGTAVTIQHIDAGGQQPFHGALHVEPALPFAVMERRHGLARGVERQFVEARRGQSQRRLVELALSCRQQQRALGRVAGHAPAAVLLVQAGVVAEHAGDQHFPQRPADHRPAGRPVRWRPARRPPPCSRRCRPRFPAPPFRFRSACRSCPSR